MAAESFGVVKDRFTSLDTLSVVRELRALPRARVDKVFDLPSGGLSIVFRVPGEGRRELLLIPGRYAALVEGTERAEELSPLARELRRLLTGTRLSGAAEPGGERYLELEMLASSADPPLLLAVELFGTGNVLVARDGKILAVQHAKTWAHRTVRIGAPYERPPVRVNPWTSGVAEIEAALLASRTDRATTLAARLALGGPVAEEILTRADLAGETPAPTEAARAARAIHAAVAELLSEVGEHPKGYLYRREGLLVDVEPYRSRRLLARSDVSEEARPTFSEAAVLFFGSLTPAPSPPVDTAARALLAELERQKRQQASAVMELGEEAARLASDADAILVEYSEVERLIQAAREASDPSKTVEVPRGERSVPVRVDRPIRESAQELYEEAKRVRTKLEGAVAALAETDRRIAEARPVPVAAVPGGTGSPARRRTVHWFERYRWFLSSEGVLVIGGRDAASNDLIVRRYLNEADIYVHADIHGAPSVIVKHPPPGEPPAGDSTLRQACQWGVAFSKAWRAGLASASAFWVNADQVSKAGASGEFVSRGAWVIHGTKNTFKDLPTEVAIGTVRYEGEELWTVAPPAAFEGGGEARFVLTPGEERERAEREVELSRELGLPRSRLQGMLPAGGLRLRRA
jgi:predicted ribosome quality control (RQC) complex YloA/Tae2 family protein